MIASSQCPVVLGRGWFRSRFLSQAGVIQSDGVTGQQAPDRAALVEQTLERGFPLMIFPPPLEAFFQQECEADRLRHVTASGLAAVVLFAGMLVSDWLLTPETLGLAAALRLGVFAPVVLAGLWLLRQLRSPLLTE